MAWFDDAWSYRHPVLLPVSAGTHDILLVIPPEWDEFWDNVESDGHDIRITEADGFTQIDYDRNTWNYAGKSATLDIEGYDVGELNTGGYDYAFFWIYWGNTAAADGATPVTPAGAVTGYLLFDRPGDNRVPDVRQAPGATEPAETFAKSTADETPIWWNVGPLLGERQVKQAGRMLGEELWGIKLQVLLSGADQAAMHNTDPGSQHVGAAWRARQGTWVKTTVFAGSSGTDYTLSTLIATTFGNSLISRVHDARALLKVQDVSE